MSIISATSRVDLDTIVAGQAFQLEASYTHRGRNYWDKITVMPYTSAEYPNPLTGRLYFRAITGWKTELPVVDLDCWRGRDSNRRVFIRPINHQLDLRTFPILSDFEAMKQEELPLTVNVVTHTGLIAVDIIIQEVIRQGSLISAIKGKTADKHRLSTHGFHLLAHISNKAVANGRAPSAFDISFTVPLINQY